MVGNTDNIILVNGIPRKREGFLLLNYIFGLYVTYSTSNTVDITTGSCRDSTDSYNIHVTSVLTPNISASGAGGLDTGSETSDTWYYIYVIGDSTGINSVSSLISASSSSPTLPAGYDHFRRIGSIRNDASSDFLNIRGFPSADYRYFFYEENISTLQVLSSGSATTYTNVNCAAFVPPTATIIKVLLGHDGDSGESAYVKRPDNLATSPGNIEQSGASGFLVATATTYALCDVEVNGSQQVSYAVTEAASDCDIHIVGYYDNV